MARIKDIRGKGYTCRAYLILMRSERISQLHTVIHICAILIASHSKQGSEQDRRNSFSSVNRPKKPGLLILLQFLKAYRAFDLDLLLSLY